MTAVEWDKLNREEATHLLERWLATRQGRLDWLEAQLGAPLELDSAGLRRAWDWFASPAAQEAAVGRPVPVWWIPGGKWDQPGDDERSVGADALGHYLEVALVARFPGLRHYHQEWKNKRQPPPVDLNSPTLVMRDGEEYAKFDVMPWMGGAVRNARPGNSPRMSIEARFDYDCVMFQREVDLLASDQPRLIPLLPAPTVERWDDDPDYLWVVEVDDVTAHENEELVARLATAIGNVPGVKESYHQDREQILVAGTITKRNLSNWIKTWWQTNNNPGTP